MVSYHVCGSVMEGEGVAAMVGGETETAKTLF